MRRLILLTLFCGCVLGAGPSAAAEAELKAVRVRAAGEGARVELALTAPTEPTLFTLPDPKPRVVVDLPVRYAPSGADSGTGPGAGLVTGYRYAPRDGGVRLVFDLKREAPANIERDAEGALILAIGASHAAAPSPAAKVAPKSPKLRKTIMVDAGHGGKDPGALSADGAREKDVTLATALALRGVLEKRGYRVTLTRDGDEYLPLAERVRLARAAHADLFLSLHADASPKAHSHGASVYTLSETAGARAKKIAGAHDWELDLETPPSSPAVEAILMDLAQRETKNRSAEFARFLISEIEPIAPLTNSSHRSAGFFVLLAPDVPAVLLEMGFITNKQDEKRLNDAAHRRRMAQAIARAVDSYFAREATFAASE